MACSFVSLVTSFVICLVHAIPRVNARIGNEDNLRTMACIHLQTREEYHAKVAALDIADMVRMNCWQIVGLCKLNTRGHYLITWGVRLAVAGAIGTAVATPMYVFSDWSSHRTSQGPPPRAVGSDNALPPAAPLRSQAAEPSVPLPLAASPGRRSDQRNESDSPRDAVKDGRQSQSAPAGHGSHLPDQK